MAKKKNFKEEKIKSEKREKDNEVVEEDEDFEEYDDEDEMVVNTVDKHEVKNNNEYRENNNINFNENLVRDINLLKILTFISICVSVLTLVISFIVLIQTNKNELYYSDGDSEESSDDTENVDYDTSMFTEVSGDELLDILDRDDDVTYFVAVGRSGCTFSQNFLPSLQQSVKDYDYTLYYLDTDKLDSDVSDEITEKSDVFKDKNSIFGATPIVYVIKNKKVVDVHSGYSEYDVYESFLKDNGVEKK